MTNDPIAHIILRDLTVVKVVVVKHQLYLLINHVLLM